MPLPWLSKVYRKVFSWRMFRFFGKIQQKRNEFLIHRAFLISQHTFIQNLSVHGLQKLFVGSRVLHAFL